MCLSVYVLHVIVSVLLPVPGACRISRFGYYVLVARVCKLGSAPKLVTTWTGPWREVSGGSLHVYNVQDIMTGETKDVHIVRMRAYEDSSLAVGSEV